MTSGERERVRNAILAELKKKAQTQRVILMKVSGCTNKFCSQSELLEIFRDTVLTNESVKFSI